MNENIAEVTRQLKRLKRRLSKPPGDAEIPVPLLALHLAIFRLKGEREKPEYAIAARFYAEGLARYVMVLPDHFYTTKGAAVRRRKRLVRRLRNGSALTSQRLCKAIVKAILEEISP